jgi:tetratricopeptide (TPR) repeat protein
LVLGGTGFGKNLDSLKAEIYSIDKYLSYVQEELKVEKAKHPVFLISGKIKENEGYALALWGVAVPLNNDYSIQGAVLEDNNIIVVHPDESHIHANNSLYIEGHHYFLFKSYSKNAFNADVPVRNYGDLFPEDKAKLDSLEIKVASIQSQKDVLSAELQNLLYGNKLTEMRKYLKNNNYKDAIKSLMEAKSLALNKSEVNSMLYDTYIDYAKYYYLQKDYVNALADVDEAIKTLTLTSSQEKVLRNYYFNFAKEQAENSFSIKKYQEAIEYYSICTKYDSTNFNQVKENYASSFILLGDEYFEKGKIEDAREEYFNAFDIDLSAARIIESKLSSLKKPALFYGMASIIPGFGQLLQGDNVSAFTHFMVFSVSIYTGTNMKKLADEDYNSYKNAIKNKDAVITTIAQDERNKHLAISYISFGVGVGVIVYSIIDSFSKVKEYNSRFSLAVNFKSILPNYEKGLVCSLKYRF